MKEFSYNKIKYFHHSFITSEDSREKGITTLRIFRHTMSETCYEMLKSSEHKILWSYSDYKSPNFFECFEFILADPPISFKY